MRDNKMWTGYILKYGAILGFSLCLIEFFALYMGMLFNPAMGLIYIVFVELLLMISIRRYRDQLLNGVINFLEAFLTGLFVSLFAGFIWSVYRYFQYLWVPGIIEEVLKDIIKYVENSNFSDAQKEFYLNTYPKVITPGVYSFFKTFIFNMGVGGTILSLFLASILKRKPLVNKPE